MSTTHTWYGRRGSVLLGPTEHRVARWLSDMTAHGRVTLRMVDLVAATHVERSEGYRITRNLRTLGLFGIENDQGGNHAGRRFWRTAIEHDGGALDAARHRQAWGRILAWARGRRSRVAARLAELRGTTHGATRGLVPSAIAPTPTGASEDVPVGGTFAELMRRGGLGSLMDQWGVS